MLNFYPIPNTLESHKSSGLQKIITTLAFPETFNLMSGLLWKPPAFWVSWTFSRMFTALSNHLAVPQAWGVDFWLYNFVFSRPKKRSSTLLLSLPTFFQNSSLFFKEHPFWDSDSGLFPDFIKENETLLQIWVQAFFLRCITLLWFLTELWFSPD